MKVFNMANGLLIYAALNPDLVNIIRRIVFIALFAIGIFFIILAVTGASSYKNSRNINKLSSQSDVAAVKKNESIVDKALRFLIKIVAKLIHINPIKRSKLEHELEALNINYTPEEYYASAYVKGGLVILLSPIGLLIHPFMTVILVVAGIILFILEYNSVNDKMKKRRRAIERELPRFVSVVSQTLKNDRDVAKLLANYINSYDDPEVTNTPLVAELKIVLADMKTGDYEQALSRFSTRVNSIYVEEAVRGLISTVRGDDTTAYFELLNNRLWENEKIIIEREAMKQPNQVKYLVIVMLGCMFLIYVAVFGVVIWESLSEILSAV